MPEGLNEKHRSMSTPSPKYAIDVAAPDIRLRRQFNMFPSVSSLFLRWRGPKSIAKPDGEPLPDFLLLDPPLPVDNVGLSTSSFFSASAYKNGWSVFFLLILLLLS